MDRGANTEILSRALHSSIFSLLGAVGFIASATLPPHAYSVSSPCGDASNTLAGQLTRLYRLVMDVSLSQPRVLLPVFLHSSGGFPPIYTRRRLSGWQLPSISRWVRRAKSSVYGSIRQRRLPRGTRWVTGSMPASCSWSPWGAS